MLQAYYGIDNEDLWRLATGLGAGMSRRQTVCGALTGGIMACGLVLGRKRAATHDGRIALRDETYERARTLMRRFEERFGTIECREMVGCDFSTPEGRQQFKASDGLRKVCEPAVSLAVETVPELCG